MRAALVTAFGQAPRCADIEEPIAAGPDQVVVEVLAAALSPRVRSQADGSHYTSTGALPVVPGIDGVGRLPDGGLVYFLLPGVGQGSMAERVAIDRHRSVALPDDADPAALAAAMNPAMASWVALRRRTEFRPGQRVLVLGATGSAGRAAVEVAHRLGAGDVVAAGRRAERMADLPEVGATRLVELGGDPAEAARALAEAGPDVDVVLDFLWGEPTRAALLAIIPARTRDEQTSRCLCSASSSPSGPHARRADPDLDPDRVRRRSRVLHPLGRPARRRPAVGWLGTGIRRCARVP